MAKSRGRKLASLAKSRSSRRAARRAKAAQHRPASARAPRRSPSAKRRSLSPRAARSLRARRLREKREAGTLPRRRRRSPVKSKPRKRRAPKNAVDGAVLSALVQMVSASKCGSYTTQDTCPEFSCDWDEVSNKCQSPRQGIVQADEDIMVGILGNAEQKAQYYTNQYFKVQKQLQECLAREKRAGTGTLAPAPPPAPGVVNILVPRKKVQPAVPPPIIA